MFNRNLIRYRAGTRSGMIRQLMQTTKITTHVKATRNQVVPTSSSLLIEFKRVLFSYTQTDGIYRLQLLHTKCPIVCKVDLGLYGKKILFGDTESYFNVTSPWPIKCITCRRRAESHSPLCADLVKVIADNACANYSFWYTTLEKNTHLALIQHTETGAFHCICPGCISQFSCLADWWAHYNDDLLPKIRKLTRIHISDGKIFNVDNASFQPYRGPIQPLKLPYEYKSLCDPARGKRYTEELEKKLDNILRYGRRF